LPIFTADMVRDPHMDEVHILTTGSGHQDWGLVAASQASHTQAIAQGPCDDDAAHRMDDLETAQRMHIR
jgi:hypothetical protein